MSKPAEVRIMPCGACGGDGGHHDFADAWTRCDLCLGEGEMEIEVRPVEPPKCKRCRDPYFEDESYDSFETGLCYHCFEDSLEEYEDRRRERIARANEY